MPSPMGLVEEGLMILRPCRCNSQDGFTDWGENKLSLCLFKPKEKQKKSVAIWSGLPSEIQPIHYHRLFVVTDTTFKATLLIRVTLPYPTHKKKKKKDCWGESGLFPVHSGFKIVLQNLSLFIWRLLMVTNRHPIMLNLCLDVTFPM